MSVWAVTCLLDPEVVDDYLKRKRHAEEVQQSEQENRKIDVHTALANEVYAIRTLNKQSAEWTVTQTKTMALWYKQAGDLPLTTTKQLLLSRYHETMMHGNAARSTSCNCDSTTSSPFGHSYCTRRYDGRSTNQSKNNAMTMTTVKKCKKPLMERTR
jgi:hypothetical protein